MGDVLVCFLLLSIPDFAGRLASELALGTKAGNASSTDSDCAFLLHLNRKLISPILARRLLRSSPPQYFAPEMQQMKRLICAVL